MNLRAADEAAQRHPARTPDDPVQRCSAAPERTRIRIQVVGEDALGLAAIALILGNAGGGELRARTAADGCCQFDGLVAGNYHLCLPELDTDAWQVLGVDALSNEDARSAHIASWAPAAALTPGAPLVHRIVAGECISMIALRYGFFPATIWASGDNAALRAARTSLYVLTPGDLVAIPALRPQVISAAAGTRIVIRRRGVPERLRIRFLDYQDRPRAGLPYLLSVETASGTTVAMRSALTDADGFVDASIPPDAIVANIVFACGTLREAHRFELGRMEAANSLIGWQTRLANLGYHCGDGTTVDDTALQAAIADFQRERQLPVTGKMNSVTFDCLCTLALS
jgi:hypothetical protein